MSNKTLFIGGSADGRRVEVPDMERYYFVSVPGGGTDEYYRTSFQSSHDDYRVIFVLTGLTATEALDRLINFYVAPDKSVRGTNVLKFLGE